MSTNENLTIDMFSLYDLHCRRRFYLDGYPNYAKEILINEYNTIAKIDDVCISPGIGLQPIIDNSKSHVYISYFTAHGLDTKNIESFDSAPKKLPLQCFTKYLFKSFAKKLSL